MNTILHCSCGAVEIQLTGKPLVQYFCHCDDCQVVHGKAYACSLHPASSVSIQRGETDTFTLKTSPRTGANTARPIFSPRCPVTACGALTPICFRLDCSVQSFTCNAGMPPLQ